MAVYKVPQDVEAEDKLLGPLTLKQFIFTIIFILLGYVAFTLGRANPVLMIPFIPPMALFGYLAAPFHRDQPTDVYLGARLRFLFKPRKRIWDQSGMEELVRITVPKKVEVQLTNNLDQSEVRSRLNILASTIDSRGWATKNAYVNDPQSGMQNSDRLVSISQLQRDVPDLDITAADDVLDPANNRTAYHMDQLAQQAASTIRQQAVQQMNQVAQGGGIPPAPMAQPSPTVVAPAPQQPTPEPLPDLSQANSPAAIYNPYPQQMRQHVIQPMHGNLETSPSKPEPTQKQTTEALPQSAKIGLAQRDDLSVEAIAHEADRVVHGDGDGDEVVINLH